MTTKKRVTKRKTKPKKQSTYAKYGKGIKDMIISAIEGKRQRMIEQKKERDYNKGVDFNSSMPSEMRNSIMSIAKPV